MPFKSKKQLKMFEAIAHSSKSKMKSAGPSKETAEKMLSHDSSKHKSKLMKSK